MDMNAVADAINDQLIRLGHSEYCGSEHPLLAAPDTAGIVMTHPRKQFEVALYDGPRLLAVLQAVSEADWATMERILDQAMIG